MKITVEKILVAVIVIYAMVVTFENNKIESLYNAEIEKNITIVNDSIDTLNLRIKNLTQKQQIRTKNVQKESNDINEKLKQDEKIIDDSNISDDELADFIAKHENG